MNKRIWIFLIVLMVLFLGFFKFSPLFESVISYSPGANKNDLSAKGEEIPIIQNKNVAPVVLPLDTVLYDKKLKARTSGGRGSSARGPARLLSAVGAGCRGC